MLYTFSKTKCCDRENNILGQLVLVAILWGATNPFIKRGSKGIENVKGNSLTKQFLLELKYLVTNIYVMEVVIF